MQGLYAVQVVAQPLIGTALVLVAKHDQQGPGLWRFPLARHLWQALGDRAGEYVATQYTMTHPTEIPQLRPGSLGAAIQASLRTA